MPASDAPNRYFRPFPRCPLPFQRPTVTKSGRTLPADHLHRRSLTLHKLGRNLRIEQGGVPVSTEAFVLRRHAGGHTTRNRRGTTQLPMRSMLTLPKN